MLSGAAFWIPGGSATPQVASESPAEVEATFPSNKWTGVTYDSGGSVTTAGIQTYTYDGENRLKTAVVGGVTTTYDYDGDGRRVKKVDGFGTTYFVYPILRSSQPFWPKSAPIGAVTPSPSIKHFRQCL